MYLIYLPTFCVHAETLFKCPFTLVGRYLYTFIRRDLNKDNNECDRTINNRSCNVSLRQLKISPDRKTKELWDVIFYFQTEAYVHCCNEQWTMSFRHSTGADEALVPLSAKLNLSSDCPTRLWLYFLWRSECMFWHGEVNSIQQVS